MRYDLYVPAATASHDIRPGSAIIGERRGDMIDTHYEGGGAANVQTYEERIHQAAGRRSTNYPTSARRAWDPDDLVQVGTIAYSNGLRHWVVESITDEHAMRAWIGEDDTVAPGGSDALFANEGGRRFGDLSRADQLRIASMRLPPAALGAEIVAIIDRMTRDPE